MRILLLLALLPALTACGERVVLDEASSAESPYDGPLSSGPLDDDSPAVEGRGGAAVGALECTHEPGNGGGADYDSGLSTVQDDVASALENWIAEDWFEVPGSGYVVERDDGDRVLLSYDVGGLTKVAVIAADGITDWDGDTGWGVETWATCDLSELPDELVGQAQVWTDASGVRVPTTEVVSWPGPEHCDWQHITFLTLGDRGQKPRQYLGGERLDDLQTMLLTTYAASVPLPAGARDSGYRRVGRELWLTADAAYLVTPGDGEAERWPRADQLIYCA